MSFGVQIYRWIGRYLVSPFLRRNRIPQVYFTSTKPCLWFHAASVGELEALRPLIENWGRRPVALVVTAFSPSAEWSLRDLVEKLRAEGADIAYSGYSPFEGRWREALQFFRPVLFITQRYEAWPDLWWSLAELEIPLAIFAATAGSSMKWMSRLNRLFLGRLPALHLYSVESHEEHKLLELFPSAEVLSLGDLRWDRIQTRLKNRNPRVEVMQSVLNQLERPLGVLGSVWPEDWKVWEPWVQELPGTQIWVPHKTDETSLSYFETKFRTMGMTYCRWSQLNSEVQYPSFILVDEMGFLAELYAIADWAYVGGGFGSGVHSTMEPAVSGVPIVAGTRRSERFPEIRFLRESGQLVLVQNSSELHAWLKKWVLSSEHSEPKDRFRAAVEKKCGALTRADGVLSRLLKIDIESER